MTARTAAAAGRQFAIAQMVDECLITRSGGEPVLDDDTGLLEPAAATTVYEGRCRLRTPADRAETEELFGEEQVTTTRYVLDLPYTTAGIQIEDLVTITTSEDSETLDLELRIVTRSAETIYVMKCYGCEVVE